MANRNSFDNGGNGHGSALDAIFWRDEILQVMFWMRGEGLGDAPTVLELATFLNADADVLAKTCEQMARDDFVTRQRGNRYSLTERGRREGARLFMDEFRGLTGQAHGECNNPNCSCKTQGPAACAERLRDESSTMHAHR